MSRDETVADTDQSTAAPDEAGVTPLADFSVRHAEPLGGVGTIAPLGMAL